MFLNYDNVDKTIPRKREIFVTVTMTIFLLLELRKKLLLEVAERSKPVDSRYIQ